MIKRCPWCGEDTKNNKKGSYIYGMKCNSCNNKFVVYRKNKKYILMLFVVVILIISSIIFDMPYFSYFSIIALFVNELILSICPYVKESDHYVIQKRQYARINLYNKEISHISFPKLEIVENQIFTVCFVDINERPISQMICVSTESVRWEKVSGKFKCVLAYLPLGKLDKEYTEETKFYLFYNNKKIGEGFLGKMLEGFNNYL